MPLLKNLIEVAERIDRNTGLSENINKGYLLLISNYGDEELEASEFTDSFIHGEYYVVRGRRTAFNFIIEQLNIYNINLLKSFVLSGNLTLGKEMTVYTFLRLCIEKYRYGGTEYTTEFLDQSVIDSYNAEGKDIDPVQLTSIYKTELLSPA